MHISVYIQLQYNAIKNNCEEGTKQDEQLCSVIKTIREGCSVTVSVR